MNLSAELDKFCEEWRQELQSKKGKATPPSFVRPSQLEGISNSDNVFDFVNQSLRSPTTSFMSFEEKDDDDPILGIETYPAMARKRLKHLQNDRPIKKPKLEDLVSTLITDIDELIGIPFFDVIIPKEVALNIFSLLSVDDLLKCGLVSKEWKQLSEDEVLWAKICRKQNLFQIDENASWKENYRLQTTRKLALVYNWKNRIMNVSKLDHVSGGVLTCCSICDRTVASGYNNGDIKVWDLESQNSKLFRPSSTALVLSEGDELGSKVNYTTCVDVGGDFAVAGSSLGFVEAWRLSQNDRLPTCSVSFGDEHFIRKVKIAESSITLHSDTVVNVLTLEDDLKQIASYTVQENCSVLDLEISSEIRSPWSAFVVDGPRNTYWELRILTEKFCSLVERFALGKYFCLFPQGHLMSIAYGYLDGSIFGANKLSTYDLSAGKLARSTKIPCGNISSLHLLEDYASFGFENGVIGGVDIRSGAYTKFIGHSSKVTKIQSDHYKIVSGDSMGYTFVWDRRMVAKLWEVHDRHPVKYLNFKDDLLFVGNIPNHPFPERDEDSDMYHIRYRGDLTTYDFLADLDTKGIPLNCYSTYDEAEGTSTTVGLAVPYDSI